MKIKHPEITVELSGSDGNAFSVIGEVSKALKRGGVPEAEVKTFSDEAMSGDYDNVLDIVMRWVDVV